MHVQEGGLWGKWMWSADFGEADRGGKGAQGAAGQAPLGALLDGVGVLSPNGKLGSFLHLFPLNIPWSLASSRPRPPLGGFSQRESARAFALQTGRRTHSSFGCKGHIDRWTHR